MLIALTILRSIWLISRNRMTFSEVKYTFTLSEETKSANKISNNSDCDILLQQSSSYVAVPEIARGPNARKSSGIIQLDSFQDIIFEGTMSFSSYKYYIGASVYFDHIGYYSTIFSIYTTVWLTSTTTHNPLWTLLIYRGPNYIYLFNYLYGSTSFSGSYALIYTTPTGWLYFGCYLESNIVEGNVVNSYYFKVYNSTGDLVTIPAIYPAYTGGNLLPHGGIGALYVGAKYYIMNGLIQYLDICDDNVSCKQFPLKRSDFIVDKLSIYEHYWDLTQNTTIDSTDLKNPCLRMQEYGASNVYFTSDSDGQQTFVSNLGWLMLSPGTWTYTDNINFDDSHQISIQFEVFPLTPTFSFDVYPYEADFAAKTNRMKFTFTETQTIVSNPALTTTSVVLQSQKWNQVFICLGLTEAANTMRVSIFSKVLVSNQTTSQPISSYIIDVVASTYKLSGSQMNIKFYNAPIILKSIKFYKWAINLQTLTDMGIYSYPNDTFFKFQSEFVSGYYAHFTNGLAISDTDNTCMKYMSGTLSSCLNLTYAATETCPAGYQQLSLFCIHQKCGNGRLELDNGEQCDDGNLNNGDCCSNTCTKEFACKCDNVEYHTSFCYPNCGDKIRDTMPIIEICDDGNNMSGDGCSSACQIEPGYTCVHSTGGEDVCTTSYTRPVVTSSSIDIVQSQILITFDQTMLSQVIDDNDISISITGPNLPYSVSWLASFDKNQLIVSFSSTPIIVGGNGETVMLTLVKADKFKSEHLIPMLSSKVISFVLPKTEPSKGTQSSGAGASYTFMITILISIGVSILTGGSMELMWGLTNTLQIIFLYRMLNLGFSSDLQAVFSFMRYSNFDNPVTDYIKKFAINGLSLIQSTVSSQFSAVGFSSSDFLSNSLDKLVYILFLILFACVIGLLAFLYKKRTSKIISYIKKLDMKIRYESMSRFYVEAMLNLTVSSLINIIYGQTNNVEQIIAYVIACIAITCILFVQLYAFLYPCILFESILIYPDHNERHCLLFLEFKRQPIKCMHFYAYFLLRRLSFAFVLVTMKEFTGAQCVLILALSLWTFGYHARYRPFENCLQNVLCIFNELILVIFSVLMFPFLNLKDPSQATKVSYACIGLITVFFAVNWLTITPVIISRIILYVKQKCTKKTEQEIEEEEKRKTIRIIPSYTNRGRLPNSTTMVRDYSQFRRHDFDLSDKNVIVERILK